LFSSARGVQGSPFLRRKMETKIAQASSSKSNVEVSPPQSRRNMSSSRIGSSSNISRSMSKLSGTSALLLWTQKRVKHCDPPSGWKTGWQDGKQYTLMSHLKLKLLNLKLNLFEFEFEELGVVLLHLI
jgi:hypothetical protein